MRNLKVLGVLFGVALVTTLLAKAVDMMDDDIAKKELARDVVDAVADQVILKV